MHRPGRNTGGAPVKKSIAIVVTVRAPLARILCDPDRDLAERAGLLADTIDGRGWYCARVNRRGFVAVDLAALVPEGGAQLLTLAPSPRRRRRILQDLARYGGLLFVRCDLADDPTAPPVRVQGVKIDDVRDAEAARDLLAEEWHPDTRVRLARYALADGRRAG